MKSRLGQAIRVRRQDGHGLRVAAGCLGAEVVLEPQLDGAPGQVTSRDMLAAAATARLIARERGGLYVDQFNAPEGIAAHRSTSGPEIWAQSGGWVDAWVAAVGNVAAYMGVAMALREQSHSIVRAAVEPLGCNLLAEQAVEKELHLLQGIVVAPCRAIGTHP